MNSGIKWSMAAMVLLMFAFAGYQLSESGRFAQKMLTKYDTQVLLYGASWCQVCASARRYFKRNGIEYVEVDVEADTSTVDEFRQLGGLAVPVIVVNGKVMRGFEPNKIEQWLPQLN